MSRKTEREGYRITVTPANPAPTITIRPPSGTSFLASDSPEILVEASDSDGTISKVQLFRGDFKIAETTSSPLRYTLDNVPSGTYTFTAKAIDNAGAVSVSSSVVITVNASGPAVSLCGVQPFFTSSPGTLMASIVGVNPGALTTLTLNGTPLVARGGEFLLPVALAEGENNFRLEATDNQSRTHQASTTVYLDSILPVIAITEPANNASFGTTRINVSGTYTESSLKRITVNGVLAFSSAGTFKALNVPIAEGANTVTATAEDIAGNTQTATISVTGSANPVDPVQLQATPVGGFASLNVHFTVVKNVPETAQAVLYDWDGNGTTDDSRPDVNPVDHVYDTAGQYFPVVTLQTSAGRFSSPGGWNAGLGGRLRINVQAPPQQVGEAIPIVDPVDLKTTANGHLFILSRSTATITEFDANLAEVRSKSSIGTTPTGLDVDSQGRIYVALSGENHVARFALVGGAYELDASFGAGGIIGSSGSGNGQFNSPFDVAVTPDGEEIAVSDSANHRIQRFSKTGAFLEAFGRQGSGVGEFNNPKGLVYSDARYLCIVDGGNNRISLVRSGDPIGTSGAAGTALGQFQGALNPGLGIRGVYVADTGNNRVQLFEPIASANGAIRVPLVPRATISTGFTLNQPNAVASVPDLLEERIYIADTGNDQVILVKLPTENPQTTWAGMRQQVLLGNLDAAISFFAAGSAEKYRQAYFSIGQTDLIALISDIPATPTPVFIESDTAQYRFEQMIDGITISFPIDLVKENGLWKIMEH